MKPFRHCRNSAKRFGGVPEDYQDIHDFLDQSKSTHVDMRHRALLHHTLGCFLVEQVFGAVRKNSAGRSYSPRDVAEQHILEDLGTIPAPSDYLRNMTLQNWMGGPAKRTRRWVGKWNTDVDREAQQPVADDGRGPGEDAARGPGGIPRGV